MDKRLPKEITENKWIRLALRLIPFVPLFIGAIGFRSTALDNDTYWIIKTGEYVCYKRHTDKGFFDNPQQYGGWFVQAVAVRHNLLQGV